MKKTDKLSGQFQPQTYELKMDGDKALLKIIGNKIGRPNKRVVLHQKGLKVSKAKVVRRDKKGDQVFEATRINHLPTFEQVRLHTDEVLYPGHYEINLEYRLPANFDESKPSRLWLPSIDEPEAWPAAEVKILPSGR